MIYIISLMLPLIFIAFWGLKFPCIVNNVTAKTIGVIIIIGYLIFVYSRPLFFRDTTAYIEMYDDVKWTYLNNINLFYKEPNTFVEYGFVFLMLIFKSMHIPFRIFSAILSLLTFIINYKFCLYIEKKINPVIGVNRRYITLFVFMALYMAYYGTFYNLVAVRAWLSITLLLVASRYIIEKKYLLAILFFFLAFTMQRFAVLGLIQLVILFIPDFQWFILKKRDYYFLWITLGALMLVSYLFQDLIFTTIWEKSKGLIEDYYSLNSDKQTSSITKGLMYFSYWFSGIVIYRGYKETKLFSKFVLIYCVSLLFCVLFSGYVSAYRIIDYFYIYSVALNFSVFYGWKRKKIERTILYLMYCVLFFAVMTKFYTNWYTFDSY